MVFHIQFLNCISKLESTQLHGKKRHYCFGFAWIPVGFTHFPERQHSDHTARKITLLFSVPAHTDLQEKAHAEAISVTENMRFKLSDLKSPSLILLHLKQTNPKTHKVLFYTCHAIGLRDFGAKSQLHRYTKGSQLFSGRGLTLERTVSNVHHTADA